MTALKQGALGLIRDEMSRPFVRSRWLGHLPRLKAWRAAETPRVSSSCCELREAIIASRSGREYGSPNASGPSSKRLAGVSTWSASKKLMRRPSVRTYLREWTEPAPPLTGLTRAATALIRLAGTEPGHGLSCLDN